MKKYLHIFRYHHEDLQLYLLEQKYIFGKKNNEARYFESEQIFPMEESCFGEAIIDVFHFAENLYDLRDFLSKNLPFLENVRLENLSIGFLEKCTFDDLSQLFGHIKLKAKLKNPDQTWLLTRTEKGWYFGKKISSSKKYWRTLRQKPETISSGLPHIMARSIALCLRSLGAKSLIDYCCGSGTVSLEASSLHLKTTALDINENMTAMTVRNLKHFHLEAKVINTSAVQYFQTADCGIVDFPYGYHCKRDIEEEKKIIHQVIEKTKLSCLIHGEDLSPQIEAAGGTVFEKIIIPSVNLKRHLHFIRSSHHEH